MVTVRSDIISYYIHVTSCVNLSVLEYNFVNGLSIFVASKNSSFITMVVLMSVSRIVVACIQVSFIYSIRSKHA